MKYVKYKEVSFFDVDFFVAKWYNYYAILCNRLFLSFYGYFY